MGQAPELGIHVQRVPDYYYPGTGIQNAEFVHSERQVEGAPDSQQGRLALQPFVGKEIYLGPGSGFLEWGKEFVRQVSFSERACELSWPEDIKTDVLGQQLPGTAQKYYRRRQVEFGDQSIKPCNTECKGYFRPFPTRLQPFKA